jgi:hypothetical protein
MAIYHLTVAVLNRSKGRTPLRVAAYYAGIVITDPTTGEVYDYKKRRKAIYSTILAPPGAPKWVFDRTELWQRAEAKETRKDSQLARTLQLSLPGELTIEQQIRLVEEFVNDQCVAFGMVADIALRKPLKKQDSRNFHAHVLLTTRNIRANNFCLKNRDWNDRKQVYEWRRQWAIYVNCALEQAGCTERIDHRSLKEQQQAPSNAPFTGEAKRSRSKPINEGRQQIKQVNLTTAFKEIEELKRQVEELRQQLKH